MEEPLASGRFGCALAASHCRALLGPDGERSALQEEVAQQFLASARWIVELRADGSMESLWEVGQAAPLPAIPGRWVLADDGVVRLEFVGETPWVGHLHGDSLRFTHPVVGDVEMTRLPQG